MNKSFIERVRITIFAAVTSFARLWTEKFDRLLMVEILL